MSLIANGVAVVEAGLNRALALDPEVADRLRKLDGRVIAVTISGWDQTVFAVPVVDRLQLSVFWPDEPDVRLSGRLGDFARLAASGADKQAELLSGGVRIEGDAVLAQRFAEVFEALDIDLEAPLERMFGPIAAHRIGQTARRFFGWGREAMKTLGDDTIEFLREETGDLVHGDDVNDWMDAVDDLRTGTDRLEARIRRLERKTAEA
ncbi:SCP2 sterol-binding domain-containing protein [uncultured Abyssibacter sp.]|uniref:ubiquinone biosynthesis accessory factor UbiJ n=1 Tax=uncultured Abyssibacter sp. TaxID=2320202 RepID=UPI0032B18FC6